MKIREVKRACIMTALAIVIMANTLYAAPAKKESKPPEVLTVEKAVSYAINNSTQLKKTQEDTYIAEQNRENLEWSLNLASSEENAVKAAITLAKNEVSTALAYPNIENQKKSLELTITKYFSTILSVERSLELYDKKLELDKRDLEITKVKAELGLVSQQALDSAKLKYDQSVTNRTTKVKAIDDAYKNLAQIMGLSDISKFVIGLEVTYTPYSKSNLTGYISDAINTNYKIKEAEENYRVSKYEHDISRFDTDLLEESSEIALTQQQRNISDLKTKLTDTITTCYDSIQTLEQSYDSKQLDYAAMEKQLAIKKIQLELGKITQIEVDKYEYDMAEVYNSILDIIADHENKVHEFINPQLM